MLSAKQIFSSFDEKIKSNQIDVDELCQYNLNLNNPNLYERIKNSRNTNYIISINSMCNNCKMLSIIFDLTNFSINKELIYKDRTFIIEKYTNKNLFYINIINHYKFSNTFVYGFICGNYGFILKETFNKKCMKIDPRASGINVKCELNLKNVITDIINISNIFKENNFFHNNINSSCYKYYLSKNKIIFHNYYSPLYLYYHNTPIIKSIAEISSNNQLNIESYIKFEPEDFGYFSFNAEQGNIVNIYMLLVSLIPYININDMEFIFSEKEINFLKVQLDNLDFENTSNIIYIISYLKLKLNILDILKKDPYLAAT